MKHTKKLYATLIAGSLAMQPAFAFASQNEIVSNTANNQISPITGLSSPRKSAAQSQSLPASITITNGTYDFGLGEGEITIKGHEGISLAGKSFSLYQLFSASGPADFSGISYSINPAYLTVLKTVVASALKTDTEIDEEDIFDFIESFASESQSEMSFRQFVEAVCAQLSAQSITGTVITVSGAGEKNEISLEGLPYGYYLIDETSSEGIGSLCMVDSVFPKADITIKSLASEPSFSYGIREDGDEGNENAASVKMADLEIGQPVKFFAESTLGDVSDYTAYPYTFHGKLDQALTLNPESIRMVLWLDNTKNYTLQKDDYQLKQDGIGDDSFQILINDIKGLADTKVQNTGYGHKFQLTYSALINDNASNKTGRPGLESTLQLETPRDPDSNGSGTFKTDLQASVVYTYRINARLQDEQNTAIPSGSFRLYRDADGKQEVKVKKSENNDYILDPSAPGTDIEADSQGAFNIIGVESGTYYLKQLESADGYRVLSAPIKLVITGDINTQAQYVPGMGADESVLRALSATASILSDLSSEPKTLSTNVSTGVINLDVKNQKGSFLPSTGSSLMLGIAGSAAGLAVLAGLLSRYKNLKEKRKAR